MSHHNDRHLSHHWWDVLFGWSPTTTGILNALIHPIIVWLILVGTSWILSVVMFVWYWKMLWRIAALTSLSKVYGFVLNEKKADRVAWINEESVY